MAKTFEDSPQGRKSYTQYSQTERRTSGVYGDTTKKRGESLKAKFSGSGDKAPIGSASGAVVGSRGPIGSASGAVVGSKTSPRAEKEQSFDSGPTKKYKKFTDDDVSEAEKRVKNAEAKDGKYSDDAMQAARIVRTKKGQRPDKAAGGKSFGSTGGNSAETAKLDDYITLMAKGNSGKDNPAPEEELKAPAAAKSQGGTSSSGPPRSSVTSSVRSTPSRSSGGTPRRESPVKGAGSAAPSRGVSGGQVSASSVPSRASRARAQNDFRDSVLREDAANRANAKPSSSSGAPTVQGGRAAAAKAEQGAAKAAKMVTGAVGAVGNIIDGKTPSQQEKNRAEFRAKQELHRRNQALGLPHDPQIAAGIDPWQPTVQGGDSRRPQRISGGPNAQIGAKQPHPMQYEEAYAANAHAGGRAASGLRGPRPTTRPPQSTTSRVPNTYKNTPKSFNKGPQGPPVQYESGGTYKDPIKLNPKPSALEKQLEGQGKLDKQARNIRSQAQAPITRDTRTPRERQIQSQNNSNRRLQDSRKKLKAEQEKSAKRGK